MTSSEATSIDQRRVDKIAGRVATSYELVLARDARVAAVCARFNGAITLRLLEGMLDALDEHGPGSASATVSWVPGAFELPLAAQCLARSGTVDAVVALGAVIRGDTPHFDFVAGPCAEGLSQVALDTSIPVVFGVLTTETEAQAFERCGAGPTNKGYEAAMTALGMVGLLGQLAAHGVVGTAGSDLAPGGGSDLAPGGGPDLAFRGSRDLAPGGGPDLALRGSRGPIPGGLQGSTPSGSYAPAPAGSTSLTRAAGYSPAPAGGGG